MTERDNCFDYEIYQIDDNNFWRFYFKNQAIIQQEEIKPFQYSHDVNGKVAILPLRITHGSSESMSFINKDTSVVKNFRSYYDEKNSYDAVNINYENNINSKTRFLKHLADSLVTQFYKSKISKVRR